MPNDPAFLDEMSEFLRKVRAHAPTVRGNVLTNDLSYALSVGFSAARDSDSATEAVALASSVADGQSEETRGAAMMAAFIGYAYSSDQDPCPRVDA
jgi:hypothetical protein